MGNTVKQRAFCQGNEENNLSEVWTSWQFFSVYCEILDNYVMDSLLFQHFPSCNQLFTDRYLKTVIPAVSVRTGNAMLMRISATEPFWSWRFNESGFESVTLSVMIKIRFSLIRWISWISESFGNERKLTLLSLTGSAFCFESVNHSVTIHSSLIQQVSIWISESFWLWLRVASISYSGSVFNSVNLLVSIEICSTVIQSFRVLSQWIFQSWPRIASLSFIGSVESVNLSFSLMIEIHPVSSWGSVFESMNLSINQDSFFICSMSQSLSQWHFHWLVIDIDRYSILSLCVGQFSESVNLLLMNEIHYSQQVFWSWPRFVFFFLFSFSLFNESFESVNLFIMTEIHSFLIQQVSVLGQRIFPAWFSSVSFSGSVESVNLLISDSFLCYPEGQCLNQ